MLLSLSLGKICHYSTIQVLPTLIYKSHNSKAGQLFDLYIVLKNIAF